MIIAYASFTGNIKRFVSKIDGYEKVHINKDTMINEPFVLITYTNNFGSIPEDVQEFLKHNSDNMVAVIGSGNTNWGASYNLACIKISSQYNVPLLHMFEMSGTKGDLSIVLNKLKEIEGEINQCQTIITNGFY